MIAGGKMAENFLLGFLFLFGSDNRVLPQIFPKLENDSGRDEQTMINLRLWHPWENEGEAYKKSFLEAVEEYNKTHDRIQILAEGTEMELYREKLPSAIASNDTPDIYFCFGDSYLQGAVSSGKLLKMNEFLSDDTGSRFHADVLESTTYEGGIYGLGFSESIAVLFVNEDMFERTGAGFLQIGKNCWRYAGNFLPGISHPLPAPVTWIPGFRLYLESIWRK